MPDTEGCQGQAGRRTPRARGFTLLELLVALAVLAIATTIFASLFIASRQLARTSENHRLAAATAREQLILMRERPDLFVWADAAPPAGETRPVTRAGAEGAEAAALPEVLPLDPRSAKVARTLREGLTWRAFVRNPGDGQAHVEVTVVVEWPEAGRDRRLALTTAMAKQRIWPGTTVALAAGEDAA